MEGRLSTEGANFLEQGINLLFLRWSALQMAVENDWGGRDSKLKSQNLASDVLSWFIRTKESDLYIDDLEDILEESMISLFNTEVEDDSIEEISEKLMVMHEECLNGDYSSIQKLKDDGPVMSRLPHVRQAGAGDDEEDDDSDDDDDDEGEAMVVERPEVRPEPRPRVGPNHPQVAEEGWTIVAPRRGGNGRRN